MPLYGFYWADVSVHLGAELERERGAEARRAVGANTATTAHYSTDELKLILRGRRGIGAARRRIRQDEWNTIAHSLDFQPHDGVGPDAAGVRNDRPAQRSADARKPCSDRAASLQPLSAVRRRVRRARGSA